MLSSLSAKQALQNQTKRSEHIANTKNAVTATHQEPQDQSAVQLKLSDDAKKWSAFSSALQAYQVQHQEDRKAKSRERLEEIKRRIQELKQLLMMFGSLGAKALLRELKQLSGELKQVAGDMKESSGNSGGALSSMVIHGAGQSASGQEAVAISSSAEAEAAANYVPDEVVAEESSAESAVMVTEDDTGMDDAANTAASASTQQQSATAEETRKQQEEKQRRDDMDSLKEAVTALKSLLALLKSMLRSEDINKDTQKQLKEITQLINDTEEIAQQSGSLGAISGGDLNVNISVDVSVTV